DNTICAGTSVTFTATPTNGGSTPAYQWKLNGNNVGTNSTTYTNTTLANNDVVTCVLTSNANCATGSPATSNAITMTVNPAAPAAPTLTPASNISCSSFTANWNASTGATAYFLEVAVNSNFNNIVFIQTTISNNFYNVTGLT